MRIPQHEILHERQKEQVHGRQPRERWPGEQQQVLNQIVQRVEAREDLLHDRRVTALRRQASANTGSHRRRPSGFFTSCAISAPFSPGRAIAVCSRISFESRTDAEIVEDADEVALASRSSPTERWTKRRSILPARRHLPADADDLLLAGLDVVFE